MKRFGYLWDKVISLDNLELAYQRAKNGKNWYKEIKKMEDDPQYRFMMLVDLRDKLKNKTFTTSKYETFERIESHKLRKISKLPFYPDRIVQWAVMNVLCPIIMKNLTSDTYSSIPGGGVQKMIKKINRDMHNNPKRTQYALQLDIKSFYASIHKGRLKSKYRKLIKDPDVLWLMDNIINSYDKESARGIPIGNYTSQYSANLYLSAFDHYIKEKLRVEYYYRYMDDILILGSNKKWLWNIYNKVVKFLHKEKLDLKDNSSKIVKTSTGISIVGYVIFKDHIMVKSNIKNDYIKQSNQIREQGYANDFQYNSIQSRTGWFKHADSHKFLEKYYDPIKIILGKAKYYQNKVRKINERIKETKGMLPKLRCGLNNLKAKYNDPRTRWCPSNELFNQPFEVISDEFHKHSYTLEQALYRINHYERNQLLDPEVRKLFLRKYGTYRNRLSISEIKDAIF